MVLSASSGTTATPSVPSSSLWVETVAAAANNNKQPPKSKYVLYCVVLDSTSICCSVQLVSSFSLKLGDSLPFPSHPLGRYCLDYTSTFPQVLSLSLYFIVLDKLMVFGCVFFFFSFCLEFVEI